MQTFDEIIQGIINALKTNGIGECTAWCSYFGGLRTVKQYFHGKGLNTYDRAVLNNFMEMQDARVRNGEITRHYCSKLIKMAKVVEEYCETGEIVWAHRRKGTKFEIDAVYERIVVNFIETTNHTDNTKGDVLWVLRKYFVFLTARGLESLSSITAKHLEMFIADCAQNKGACLGVRSYDLRHRFASTVLLKWLNEGADMRTMLPYLQIYMGHDSLESTAYYIHLLPENLLKGTAVKWAELSDLIPEVSVWQK